MHLDRQAILSAAVVAAISAISTSNSLAAEKFWDGPVNNQWTTATNWFGGEPGATDDAIFDGNGSVERNLVILGADRTVSQMRVNGVPGPGAYRFVSEGGTLTTGHVSIENGAGTVTFEGFKVNTTSMTVQPGTTLDLTTNNAQVNASFMFINGTLNWTGGQIATTNASGINVDGGVMNVTAGGRGLANGTSLHVFNGGTFTTNDYFDVGASVDAGNGPTGTLSVSGAGSVFQQTGGFNSLWGTNAGDHANVLISEGGRATLSSGVVIAHNHGSAEVNLQTGGTLHVGGSLFQAGVLSAAASKPGAGGARFGATSGGQLNGSSGGFANINISGGTLSTGSATSAAFAQGATVNLTSGNLNLGGDTTFHTGSTFNWSGGTWNNAADTTLAFDGGAGSFTLLNSASGRGMSTGSTLRITTGGSLTSNSYFAIGSVFDFGSPTGTMLVDGIGSKFTSTTTASNLFTPWGRSVGEAATITFSNSAAGSFNAGLQIGAFGGAATVNIQSSAHLNTASLLAGRASGASDGVNMNVSGGTLAVTGSAQLRNGATVNYSAGSMAVGGPLLMNGDSQVLLTTGGNKVLRVGGLDMGNTSKIDLSDNDMIVGSLTSKSVVEGLVVTARNGGDWNGATGITSTAANNATPKNKTLGVLSGAEYSSVGGTGLFSGHPYVAGDTLVKFTWYGDTDFNGVVNFDDYGRTDAGFNLNRTGWLNGDFDLSGSVNFDDYGLIDLAFNTQSGTLIRAMDFLEGEDRDYTTMNTPELQQVVRHFEQFGNNYATSLLTAVPEPSAIALLAPVGALLARRRRKS